MVLLLEKLIKIDIHRLVRNDYWAGIVDGYKLELNPVRSGETYFLMLDVNGSRAPQRWMLSTRSIRGRLWRGGRIPWGSEVWYVHGANNKRRRFLYINAATCEIGTRDDHGARYRCCCLSHKQWLAHKRFRDTLKEIRRSNGRNPPK
jgi:hypothetical protein